MPKLVPSIVNPTACFVYHSCFLYHCRVHGADTAWALPCHVSLGASSSGLLSPCPAACLAWHDSTLHYISCLLPYMAATANKRHSAYVGAAACYGRILCFITRKQNIPFSFYRRCAVKRTRGLELVATRSDWTGYLDDCLRYCRCYVASSTPRFFFSYRALSLHQAADCPGGLGS